jgi:hypothetical protein
MVKKAGESTKEHKARLIRERDDITLKIIQHRHEGNSVTDTCRLLNITRPTYFKYLREKGYGDFGKDNLYTRYVAKPTPVGSLFLANALTEHCNEHVLENRVRKRRRSGGGSSISDISESSSGSSETNEANEENKIIGIDDENTPNESGGLIETNEYASMIEETKTASINEENEITGANEEVLGEPSISAVAFSQGFQFISH